jgi:hypothetical protein
VITDGASRGRLIKINLFNFHAFKTAMAALVKVLEIHYLFSAIYGNGASSLDSRSGKLLPLTMSDVNDLLLFKFLGKWSMASWTKNSHRQSIFDPAITVINSQSVSNFASGFESGKF